MIRPGKLDRRIELQREAETIDEFRAVSTTWTTFADTRAELITASLGENLKPFGEAETAAVVFRLRYVPGLTTNDRLLFNGTAFNIRAVQEIGRRQGLEIMAEALK